MDAYQKCEELLKNYNNYKMGLEIEKNKLAKKCVDKVDKAIMFLEDEKYIGIITMHYIDGLTMERIAEVYDISTVAVYSQKKRMLHKLASILCSDDAIKELLLK
jgi:predicted DNA-binding protein YlxM (UPF0122 family)